MFLKFKDKRVDLYADSGAIIRRYNSASNVANAIINGDGTTATIAITEKNGKVTLYNTKGQVIRRK